MIEVNTFSMVSNMEANVADVTWFEKQIEKGGWLLLEPRSAATRLPSIVFPLYQEATYSVGSLLTNDFVLPSDDKPIPTSTIQIVGDGKVIVKTVIDKGGGYFLDAVRTIDFLAITHSAYLERRDVFLTLGQFDFSLKFTVEPNIQFRRTWYSLGKCVACQKFKYKSLSRLTCCHSACEECINAMVESALDTSREIPSEQFEYLLQIVCPKCSVPSMLHDLMSFTQQQLPHSFENVLVPDTRTTSLSCSHCQTFRCLPFGSREHYFCKTCKLIFCPLCILDMHREHDVVQIYATLMKNFNRFQHDNLPVKWKFRKMCPEFEAILETHNLDVDIPFALIQITNDHLDKVKGLIEPSTKLFGKLNKNDADYAKNVEIFGGAVHTLKDSLKELNKEVDTKTKGLRQALSIANIAWSPEIGTMLKNIPQDDTSL